MIRLIACVVTNGTPNVVPTATLVVSVDGVEKEDCAVAQIGETVLHAIFRAFLRIMGAEHEGPKLISFQVTNTPTGTTAWVKLDDNGKVKAATASAGRDTEAFVQAVIIANKAGKEESVNG